MRPQSALAEVVNAVSDAVVGIRSPAQGPRRHRVLMVRRGPTNNDREAWQAAGVRSPDGSPGRVA